MYRILLIARYLRRKLAPLFAAVAVTICTFMVIVVISVMGGFLDLLRDSAQRLTPQVMVTGVGATGFPHYEDLIERLEGLPEVASATPTIQSFGLLNLGGATIPVQVQGIRPGELSDMVDYRGSLLWSGEDRFEYFRESLRFDLPEEQRRVDLESAGVTLRPPVELVGSQETAALPGAVIGVEVNPFHSRDEQGQYSFGNAWVGHDATLTVVPLSGAGSLGAYQPARRSVVVVNEFKSGWFDLDQQAVFVPFDLLQRMLQMQPERVVGEGGFDQLTGRPVEGAVLEDRPGRATSVAVQPAAGVSAEQLRAAVDAEAAAFAEGVGLTYPLYVQTWEQVHGRLLGAVQNEKVMVTFLFSIISIVAVVMVATTFYMIVLEKTRDIGVLRSIGASRLGIMRLFVGYGLVVGVIGSLVGAGAAWALVTHLNEVQAFITQYTGWQMWDPQTYLFDRIPDRVDPAEAGLIVVGAIVSSVVGALVPAWLAGRLDPVEALRHE
jgi:lipoprotein-releasing system permease protein